MSNEIETTLENQTVPADTIPMTEPKRDLAGVTTIPLAPLMEPSPPYIDLESPTRPLESVQVTPFVEYSWFPGAAAASAFFLILYGITLMSISSSYRGYCVWTNGSSTHNAASIILGLGLATFGFFGMLLGYMIHLIRKRCEEFAYKVYVFGCILSLPLMIYTSSVFYPTMPASAAQCLFIDNYGLWFIFSTYSFQIFGMLLPFAVFSIVAILFTLVYALALVVRYVRDHINFSYP